ncbi:MAG: N-acetylmuramoyl-L-alanine amidase [Oscillospiraceae bacterium]|nr:N-acetylmuramoyl-L-alanine amidase [Oscillospiraceae bacterium]
MPSIFLSPSTQHFNLYVNGGNERQYMNYIADRMEPYLFSSGISFSRNNPNLNFAAAIAASNAGNYNVHFSVHSNAAGAGREGQVRGSEFYYDPNSYESRRLATITANNMKYIYPDPTKVRIVPTTTLGEVVNTRAVAILCEVAYHDNREDAEWIKNNLTPIAVVLVQALCDYFGIPFVQAKPISYGIVNTGGANLNIRQHPWATARLLGVIPNGASVRIIGRTGNWYAVRFNDISGFSSADFIVV